MLYQIYPRSFADSDGDGIGDLRGIIDHLPHLAGPGGLGVDAIWLSPFYPSPQVDFGYDISDHCDVDPVYGSLADAEELIQTAHSRGLAVLVDLVMNHTSDLHPWFVAARSSRHDPYRDWFVWADPAPDGGPPNNWLSSFAATGAAWTWDEPTAQYYLHSFTVGQPDLNWRNPQVQVAVEEIWRFWLDRGVDGFRIDVAHRLLKDAALRDNPPEVAEFRRHVHHPSAPQLNLDHPDVHQVLGRLRCVLDEYGDRVALGEVPVDGEERLAAYFGGTGMHTAFHIGLWEQPWSASAVRTVVDRLAAAAPDGALPTHALATHDITRPATRFAPWGGARAAALLLLTLRGVPCLYYGEELGLADATLTGPELDLDGRDGTRVPMPWGPGDDSATPSWLPSAPAGTSVAEQHGRASSMLTLYRRLLAFRRTHASLSEGTIRFVETTDPVLAFVRETRHQRLLVVLNFASRPAPVDLGVEGEAALRLVTTAVVDEPEAPVRVDLATLVLAADEGVVLELPT